MCGAVGGRQRPGGTQERGNKPMKESRCVRSLCAFVLMLGTGLAFVVTPGAVAETPLVLDWRVIGTGIASCVPSAGIIPTDICTFEGGGPFPGGALGTHIGRGTYVVNVTTGTNVPTILGGNCFTATGSGTVTAASGDKINFNTVGWLCEEGVPASPLQYNGTYRICSPPTLTSLTCPTPGTGRFSAAAGGGSLAATLTSALPTSITPPSSTTGVSFFKIDGMINFF